MKKEKYEPEFVDKDFEPSEEAVRLRYKYKMTSKMVKTTYKALPNLHHLDAMYLGEFGIRRIKEGKKADVNYFKWLYQHLKKQEAVNG